ncbi:MAG: hypothetical protein FP816_07975 [Desulfobacteraceae bacterium]|nr:hypothetical protein [Desulfobacteraceae bacterium]MBU4053862.1 hypothetical protein [Pseudomonadota bacterium]
MVNQTELIILLFFCAFGASIAAFFSNGFKFLRRWQNYIFGLGPKPIRLKNGEYVGDYALADIEYTSPDEIPELLVILTEKTQSSSTKASARAKIEKIRPGSKDAASQIASALENELIKRSRIAYSLVKALASIGPEARESVPFLIKIMDNMDSEFKFQVCKALAVITKQDFSEDKNKWLQYIKYH